MTRSKIILRLIACLMLLSIAATTLSSCSFLDFGSLFGESMEDRIIGKWYNESGKCLDIREDGTYKRDREYGTGTWKLLDDTTIEFIDFYGDDTQVTIEEDEHGLNIWYGGLYYKDKYPSDVNADDPSINDNKNETESETETETEIETVIINVDPFDGIAINVSGISPYCELSIDNSECSEDAQNYVQYTFDKDTYKNGDTATITATLIKKGGYYNDFYGNNDSNTYYELTDTKYTFKVEKQPEYVTSITGLDLTYLESEMKDYVEAEKANAKEGGSYDYLFNCSFWDIVGYEKTEVKEEYFYSLKQNKRSSFNLGRTCFNRISYIYCIEVTYNGDKTGKVWVNVGAENVVKYPDGTIKWGSKSSEEYNFVYYSSADSIERCVSGSITTKSADYNIKKISK